MAFFDLRRDLDSLFADPLFTLSDPIEDYLEMRRRALDVLDSYYPNLASRAIQGGSEPAEGSSESSTAIAKPKENKELARTNLVRKWSPRCDMVEKANEVVIHAELPGMTKDQVKVDYDEEHNILTISGEKKDEHAEEKETEKGKFHYMERTHGSFMRSFRLPVECKTKMQDCKATSKDGVLEIHCPKDTEAKPTPKTRSININ